MKAETTWIVRFLTLALLTASPLPAQEGAPEVIDVGQLREQITRYEQASDYSGMVLASADLERIAASLDDRVFALRSRGRAYALLSDYDRALAALNAAVNLAEADMAAVSFAELYRDTAGLLGEIGRFDQALSLIERGLTVLADDPESELYANLLVMKGSIQGALGNLDEALSSIQSAMDLELPTNRQKIMRLNNLGMILKWRAEVDQAIVVFEQVLDQARILGNEQIIVYALLEVGDVNRILGNHSVARQSLEEALSRSLQAGKNRWLVFAHNYLAELEAAVGNREAEQAQRDALAAVQARLQDEVTENQATVLQISLELLEREQRIERMQMEGELQALRLDRSRKLSWLAGVASILLLVAFWLAVQQVRVRSAANRKLDELASTDTLTGLFNRRYLIACAEDELASTSDRATTGLVLIDLDRFKQINDCHGHEHGDAVLVEVARRIQGVMRGEDVVARWGGEEFLALLPGCDRQKATQVAERLRSAITGTPIEHQGIEHPVTATIGVALAKRGEALEQGLKRADAALYAGKENGRDRIEAAR